MHRFLLCTALLLGLVPAASALSTSEIPLADGFDLPVGKNGKSYYKARGVRPNGHLGEDWNGVGGGDTDLGDPIYSAADGIVTFAQDYRLGWGNVVIIRSAYLENGETKYVDSLYGHLLAFTVKEGQQVKRGQQIARMGNNRGMYEAHLHFEMRKNINVGMYRSSFPRDWSVYWSPTEFVADHRTCSGGSRIVSVPVDTYASSPPPVIASTKVYTPSESVSRAGVAVANGKMVSRKVPPSPLRHVYATSSYAANRTAGASHSTSSSNAGKVESSSAPRPASAVTASSTAAPTKSVAKPAPRIVSSSSTAKRPTPPPAEPEKKKVIVRHTLFRVNRFEDMKSLGYGNE